MEQIIQSWVDKYSGFDSFDNIVLPEEIKNLFKGYIEKNSIPSVIFTGTSGIGKTSLSRLLVNKLNCQHLEIDCSVDSGVDTI